MGFFGEFFAGRTHKLARDFLFASVAILGLCLGAILMLTYALEEMRVANRQNLPARVANSGVTQTQTIVRSVLDDNLTTASIGGRTIVLDPCTGKEKK